MYELNPFALANLLLQLYLELTSCNYILFHLYMAPPDYLLHLLPLQHRLVLLNFLPHLLFISDEGDVLLP